MTSYCIIVILKLNNNKFYQNKLFMNRVAHFEIHAKDLDKAQKFYADVFGWKITDLGP
jgi:uncharacterized protein